MKRLMHATSELATSELAICTTIFLLSLTEFLQSGMTAFAAAPLMGALGLDPDQFTLVAAAYASTAILAISMQRWAVERLGGRRVIQWGATLMTAGALVCAGSHGMAGFMSGRIMMALGGGVFFNASRMVIHHLLAGPRRMVGIRCLAAGLAIGIASAPWLAAIAVSNGHWGAIYGALAALAALIGVIAGFALPARTPPSADAASAAGGTDTGTERSEAAPWAQLLLLGASFLLFWALQRLYYDFFGEVPGIALGLFVALAGLALYLRSQRLSERPLLRLRALVHDTRYGFGLALFFIGYLMLGANNTAVPMLLQGAMGYGWQTVGNLQALGSCAAVLTLMVVLSVLPRHPAPRKFLVIGFTALAGFGALLAHLDPNAGPWSQVLPALALNGVFLLTLLPVVAMQTFRSLERAGDDAAFSNATQLKSMLAQAGVALGIVLATVAQQWRAAVHYAVLAEQVDPGSPTLAATLLPLQRQLLAAGIDPSQAGSAALARVGQLIAQQSAALASIDHFGAVALIGVIGIALAWRQKVFR